MRTLYMGLTGEDVRAWEYFLLGIDPTSSVIADGVFDQKTKEETKKFQTKVGFTGLAVDGIVGPATLGKAMMLGFDPLMDDRMDQSGPNWPPRPTAQSYLTGDERKKIFGEFSYVSNPTPSNPEAIKIIDGWDKVNITTITIPQLSNVSGANKGKISVHRLVAPQLLKTFSDWESAGLLGNLLTWGGSWSPRFIRGSRTYLSNHAWGTAFDVNVQWNMLGTRPALKGQKGSVRELVNIALQNGWYWGGWFGYDANGQVGKRSDGMHFECFKIVT